MCARPIESFFSIARINYLAVRLNHKNNFCSIRALFQAPIYREQIQNTFGWFA